MWSNSYSLEELNYLAENELVEIKPNFIKKDELDLLIGKFGPFLPNKLTKVPLYIATLLKDKAKCIILPPPWMEVGFLQNHLDRERNQEFELVDLHYYFYEIIQIITNKAPSDVNDLKQIKSVVQDISQIRNEKINKILKDIKGASNNSNGVGGSSSSNNYFNNSEKYYLLMNNICARELELIRPFVLEIFNAKIEFNKVNEINNGIY